MQILVGNQHTHRTDGLYRGEFNSWRQAMIARCTDPNYRRFDLYGGRGITVCDRWRMFRNFLEDMGPKPTRKHSLDRKDSNGNYEPGNCRWATQKEQMNNTSKNVLLTALGKTQTLPQWQEETGIEVMVIRHRLDRGWDAEPRRNNASQASVASSNHHRWRNDDCRRMGGGRSASNTPRLSVVLISAGHQKPPSMSQYAN